jgi:arylsulfatase A-like enzyme
MRPSPELVDAAVKAARAGENTPWERWPRSERRWRRAAALVCVSVLITGSAVVGARRTLAADIGAAPNILIILTDDQRAHGTLGVMPKTRRWFAKDGTTFPNAFVTTPLCCPSRASIFTGRYAHNHTVQSNQPGAEENFDQSTTMQHLLGDGGYRTAIYGKYFNVWDLSVAPPEFDRWGIFSPHGESGYTGTTWNIDGNQRQVDRYSTDFIRSRGVRFINAQEGNDARPWFLELATFAPHQPSVPKGRFADAPLPAFHPDPSMSETDRGDKPAYVRARPRVSSRRVHKARDEELRCLMSVDQLVGRVFSTLRADAELGNTLAFFLSDNGTLWGAHGIMGKQTPYLPSIRVPMFMRWPGQVAAGATDRRFAANIDVAPTVLEAAGLPASAAADGRSLLGVWTRPRLLTEYWRLKHPSDVPTWASIVTRSFQYVEYYSDSGAIIFREYYDRREDPWQLTNLLHDGHPGNDPRVAPLHRLLAADRACSGSTCP